MCYAVLENSLSTAASVRLVDGANTCSGRLEVLHNDKWKPVCSAFWDLLDATVVCKELGCGSARETNMENPQPKPSAWLSVIGCTGFEASLMDCEKDLWGSYTCERYAGVVCRCEYRQFFCTDKSVLSLILVSYQPKLGW